MVASGSMIDPFEQVLRQDLQQPLFLTPEEVAGGWRERFPELDSCLPSPYPIYGKDEDKIIAHGFPVLLSPGIEQLRRELERQVVLEVDYRLTSALDSGDKSEVMDHRDRYLRSMSAVIENTLLNDYGRGLLEVLLLFHSADVARLLGNASALARRRQPDVDTDLVDDIRYSIGAVLADLLQRAASAAADRLRQLAQVQVSQRLSPLLGPLCHDLLLLTETRAPANLSQLRGYLRVRLRHDPDTLATACREAVEGIDDLIHNQPEWGGILGHAVGGEHQLRRPNILLDPRLVDAISAAGLVEYFDLSAEQAGLLRELGLRLKRFELLHALRRSVLPMEGEASTLRLVGPTRRAPVAASTRPFDFTAPGVVDSSVHRFGLVYDLTSFTAQLEDLRRKGRLAEESALRFMYVFQVQLEEIRRRRRLTFEKFLGDGAFYSSRRAFRLITAACEIQKLYDDLRSSGFPFDQGMRIAMNHGTYRLLPMLTLGGGERRFEFFGHGIVELARLTTGKSTRELEEIAEFLVHSGFDPDTVDDFLDPLIRARRGGQPECRRPYSAYIDDHGELINEGIVLTIPFLEELDRELVGLRPRPLERDGLRWLVLPAEPGGPVPLYFGLRALGVARLKGLEPVELVEASVWPEVPADAEMVDSDESLVTLVRRESTEAVDEAGDDAREIPEQLVAVTFTTDDGTRRWIFGHYDAGGDVLVHAFNVPIREPDCRGDESLEMWLLRNRVELVHLYDGLRRETSGATMPLAPMRACLGYLGCFLAAPHRSPG